nr:unnamed protein product [Digitaria exilis]
MGRATTGALSHVLGVLHGHGQVGSGRLREEELRCPLIGTNYRTDHKRIELLLDDKRLDRLYRESDRPSQGVRPSGVDVVGRVLGQPASLRTPSMAVEITMDGKGDWKRLGFEDKSKNLLSFCRISYRAQPAKPDRLAITFGRQQVATTTEQDAHRLTPRRSKPQQVLCPLSSSSRQSSPAPVSITNARCGLWAVSLVSDTVHVAVAITHRPPMDTCRPGRPLVHLPSDLLAVFLHPPPVPIPTTSSLPSINQPKLRTGEESNKPKKLSSWIDQEEDMAGGKATCIDILVAIVVPPLGVFLKHGCGHEFWICLFLTFLGYIPGIIYAVYAITKY